MELTHFQKAEIYNKGYIRVPGVVPQVMVDAAVRAINNSLGEGIDPAQVLTFRSRSYAPELQKAPVITDLFNQTPALTLAESVIGAGKIKSVGGGQIALRFPSMDDPPSPPRGHLDGMYSPHNGVPKGEIRNFTMLLGVALSDVPAPYYGNLTVWPGTHHQYERYFKHNGPESLLDGMPEIELPDPVQVIAKAGDIILAHYQVAHGAVMNVSPHVRYAIYFRLQHVDHASRKFETMTDIWLDWEGMRDIVAERKVAEAPKPMVV